MQQQQYRDERPLGPETNRIMGLFKQAGVNCPQFKEAVSQLPEQESKELYAAIHNHVKTRQQQEQQPQM